MDSGTYIRLGGFIAFREMEGRSWRLSRMTAHSDATFTLALVREFDHVWEMREFVTANPDAGK